MERGFQPRDLDSDSPIGFNALRRPFDDYRRPEMPRRDLALADFRRPVEPKRDFDDFRRPLDVPKRDFDDYRRPEMPRRDLALADFRRPLDVPKRDFEDYRRPLEPKRDYALDDYRRQGEIEIVGLADENDGNLMRRREKISELRRDIPKLREMPAYREDSRIPQTERPMKEERTTGETSENCGEDLNVCFLKTPTEKVIKKLMPDNSLVSLDKKLNFLSSSGVHGSIYYSYLLLKDSGLTKKFKVALKFAKSKASDSLFYEYLVGLCVNKLRDLYPTFTRTLLISRIDGSEEYKKNISSKKDIELNYEEMEQLRRNTPNDDIISMKNLGDFCRDGENAVLMTEYIGNVGTIRNYLENPAYDFSDKLVNFVNIMFQIYYTLYGVREIFVHNDLHRDNVILHAAKDNYGYAIVLPDEGIRVRDEVIKYKNKKLVGNFIPVIIDYGRSFIDCEKLENARSSDLTTMKIARVMCKTPECKGLKSDRCGYGLGYNAISRSKTDDPIETKFEKGDLAYGFKMLTPNQSQDLRYFIGSMDVLETVLEIAEKNGLKLSSDQLKVVKFLILLKDKIEIENTQGYFIPEKREVGISVKKLEEIQYKEEISVNNITDLFVGLSFLVNTSYFQNLLLPKLS